MLEIFGRTRNQFCYYVGYQVFCTISISTLT